MRVETNLRTAVLLRLGCYCLSQQMTDIGSRRMLKQLRDALEVQIPPEVISGGGNFALGVRESEFVELELTTDDLRTLASVVSQANWPLQIAGGSQLEDYLLELPELLEEWIEQAKAMDDLKKLPAKRRRELVGEEAE